jgi:hypothetical protein
MGLHGMAVIGSNFSGYHAELHERHGPLRVVYLIRLKMYSRSAKNEAK